MVYFHFFANTTTMEKKNLETIFTQKLPVNHKSKSETFSFDVEKTEILLFFFIIF